MPPREQIRRIAVVVRRGLRGLYRTGITRMAAALAYRTIFSIIPMLAIGLLIFGSVVSEDQVDAGVRRLLGFAGISQIAVSDDFIEGPVMGPVPGENGAPDVPPAGADMPPGEAEVEFAAAEVEEIITDLVVRVNATLKNLPTGWIALVTGLILFYAALSMLIEVEKSFNAVCGAPVGRSWLRRLILYWTMITLGGVLLAATFWTGDALAAWVRGGGGSAIRGSLAGYGVSVLISTALLSVAYMAIPTVRLKFRAVLAGAFLAAVAWEMGKWGFTSYLKYSTGYARFYGSLALLPLFMLWVYVTWVIVLLGLQSAFTLQHFSRLVAAGDAADRSGPRIVDPASAVALAAALVRAYHRGENPDAGDLSDTLELDATVIESFLRRLERAGLVRRVVVGSDEETGWVPARPPESIGVGEVLDAVGDLDASRSSDESSGLLAELSAARRAAVGTRTLADMVPAPRRSKGREPEGAESKPEAG